MKVLRFALRSLVRQAGRSALGVLGVAAVGALLLDMLLLSRGLVVSFGQLLDGTGFDVRVMPTESPLPAGIRLPDASRVAHDVAALPEVAEAVPLVTGQGEIVVDAQHSVALSLTALDPGHRRPWILLSGQAPGISDPPGLLANRALLDRLAQPVGTSVQLRPHCGGGRAAPTARPFVVGTAQFPFDDEGQLSAVVTRQALRAACGDERDQADMVIVASRGGAATAVSAIRRARPDLHPVTNEQIVARLQAQGFTYFRQISAVLSTITLFFGFLLVTVLLTVSVNQRLAEIAALRALGFSSRRAAADVLVQGTLLVAAGGLLGVPLGLGLSVWLDAILKAMPGIPAAMHFFVFEPRSLALYAALLAATALLASAYPTWLVARLPIAATLRNEIVG